MPIRVDYAEAAPVSLRTMAALQKYVEQAGLERPPDDVFEYVAARFRQQKLVNLTTAIIAVNGRNRPTIAFGKVPERCEVQTANNR